MIVRFFIFSVCVATSLAAAEIGEPVTGSGTLSPKTELAETAIAETEEPETPNPEDAAPDRRVSSGLLVLYDFADTAGRLVRDRAGTRSPIHLTIDDLANVRRRQGSLEVRDKALIRSTRPPKRLTAAIRKSGAFTIEAWVQPKNTKQSGPARIVTLSQDASHRNVTLGQEGDRFDVRLRTTNTNQNGLPSLTGQSASAKKKVVHVVFTRNREGNTTLWIDGKSNASEEFDGDLSNWDQAAQLVLGNELTGGRSWLGTYHLVAIYDRSLTPTEIEQNFAVGAAAAAPPLLANKPRDPRGVFFELHVAPIFANQCLECHDSLAKDGGLDLSKKQSAIAGGDSGKVVVPGDSDESLLWQLVESNDMPHDRDPLTDSAKQRLKKWIDDGAVWTLETIDPAVYVHGGRPDANWLRRLTVPEYIATIDALFDLDVTSEARELLPADIRADGFSNTAYNLNVDLKHIEAYQKLAEIVVQRIDVKAFRRQFVTKLTFTDNGMGELIRNMGRVILRGPLEDREVVAFRGISTTIAATEDGTMDEATASIIEAMLQSPRFLYRIERQRGDGLAEPISDFELASRMSYMIWGGPPDEPLYDAAEAGEFADRHVIRQHAARMLTDRRAQQQAERFFIDWLNLDRLKNLQPNRDKFPDWQPALATDMEKETIAFFNDVVWRNQRPLSDLLNANVTFATPRLAKHYGLPPESADIANSDGELIRYDLAKTEARGGMLTQGSLLTVGGDEASMVTRGLLVMHELLRGVVKDPPPCVDTTPVPTKPGLSQRAIAEGRIANENCGGCHSRFEPLAFGLEKFDGLGAYHDEDEHGNRLREDGEIVFPGGAASVAFKSTRELMNLMAASDRVRESLTWKLTQFALGRPLTGADAGAVQEIHKEAMKNGGTYAATMMAIVASDLVTLMQTDPDD